MNRIRKIISLCMAVLTVAVSCPLSVYAAADDTKEAAINDMAAGDKLGAFTVTSVDDFKMFDAKVYELEHDKTGAKVVFIQNDDPDKYFVMRFDTPAHDNKGTAHVYEHAVMCGSNKYPSRSLSSALISRSYLTYMNAFSAEAYTLFPVASLSEDQLLSLAGYYADLCFEPMILQNEDIFKSEAWRMTLDEPDGEINLNGTVYSEMKGRYTGDVAAQRYAMGLIYPECPSSYVAGGIPQDILTLSYDEVKAYHEMYYHPSNCTAYLYGNIKEPQAFLKLLDSYFGGYDRRSFAKDRSGRKLATGYVEKNYSIPEPASSEDDNRTDMVYAIDLGKLTDEELEAVYAYAKLCSNDYSDASRYLRSLFPLSYFGFVILPSEGNIVFNVTASEMDKEDATRFRYAVRSIFNHMSLGGIEEDELESFQDRMETDAALSRDGSTASLNMLLGLINYSANGRDDLMYVRLRDRMADMSWFDNVLIKSISSKLASPPASALAVVSPDHEMYEANERKLREGLDKVAASMSDDDKKKLVADTKRIAQAAIDDPTQYLNELNVVKVSDLTDDLAVPRIRDEEGERGERYLGVYTDTENVEYTRLCLDATGLGQDMLGYLALYVDLVNGHFVPTSEHENGELPDLENACSVRGQVISLDVTTLEDDYRPYVVVDFLGSPKTAADAYNLAYERLFMSKFDDPVSIKEGIGVIMKTVRYNIENNQEGIARLTAYANDSEAAAYYDATHYIGYYDFLRKEEASIGGDYKNVCAKLKKVEEYLRNSNGAVIGYTLNEKDESAYLKCADEFVQKLEDHENSKVDYSFTKYEYPLGIQTDSRIVSNAIACGDMKKLGLTEDSVTDTLALEILTERYLRGETRDRYGAYICSYLNGDGAVSLFTGRDPMVKETFDAFSNIGTAWSEIRTSLTQDELDDYIITMYSLESVGSGPVSDAAQLLSDMASGMSADQRKQDLKTLKETTLADFEKYDKIFENLQNQGVKITVGSKKLINADKDEFAMVIDPFAN